MNTNWIWHTISDSRDFIANIDRISDYSDGSQSGNGDGKAVLKILSLQQFPVPEPSRRRSPCGNGASIESGMLSFSITTLSMISGSSGKGSMRGSNVVRERPLDRQGVRAIVIVKRIVDELNIVCDSQRQARKNYRCHCEISETNLGSPGRPH